MKRIYFAMHGIDNAGVMTQMLEHLGYEAVAVEDAAQLLNILERSIPDLILLDIEMPGLDGRQLLKTMRESLHTNIPIVAMAASARGTREHYKRFGFSDYLENPFSLTCLRSVFLEYLA